MKHTILAAAALLASSLAAAAPTAEGHGKVVAPPVEEWHTLYSQNGTDSGIGIVSQNFESSFDIYDARAADDFNIPSGQIWKIKEVDVTGVYFNGAGPAKSVNLTFYRAKNGLPGAVLKDIVGHSAGDNGTGSFMIELQPTEYAVCCKVGPRRLFVSVQANMDFSVGGEWGWENQTTVVGAPAVWENPGDGFATGCTTYAQETSCIPDGQGDHMFTIKGTTRRLSRVSP